MFEIEFLLHKNTLEIIFLLSHLPCCLGIGVSRGHLRGDVAGVEGSHSPLPLPRGARTICYLIALFSASLPRGKSPWPIFWAVLFHSFIIYYCDLEMQRGGFGRVCLTWGQLCRQPGPGPTRPWRWLPCAPQRTCLCLSSCVLAPQSGAAGSRRPKGLITFPEKYCALGGLGQQRMWEKGFVCVCVCSRKTHTHRQRQNRDRETELRESSKIYFKGRLQVIFSP